MTGTRPLRRTRWPWLLLGAALFAAATFVALRGPAIEPPAPTRMAEPADGHVRSFAAQGQVELRQPGALEGPPVREPGVDAAAPASFLQGFVADSLGGSVAAAEVRIERVDGGGAVVVTTADDGTWRQAIAPSVWCVRASKPGYGVSVAVVVDAASPCASSRLELSLLRPVVVRGCVIGNGGLALAGALVHVRPTLGARGVGWAASCASTASDGAGRFAFEAAAGFPLELSATLDGEIVVPARRVAANEDVEIVLGAPEAFCVRGQVVDEMRADAGFLPEASVGHGWGTGTEVLVDGTAVAVAADGSFVARTGAAVVEVQAKCDERTSESVLCRFDCGTTNAYVPLRLRSNVPTRGVVVDADGALRAGMTIEALAGEGGRRRVAASCATGADGAFTLQLPIGSQWWLRVVGGEEAAVTAGRGDVRLRCGLGRELVGWPLRHGDGRPVAGAGTKAVWATIGRDGVVRESAMLAPAQPPPGEAAELRGGRFADGPREGWLLREMRPAPWELFVDGVSAHLPRDERSALRQVVIDRHESICFDVRLLRGGEPVRGVHVTVENAAGVGHLQFATGGRHHFPSLPRVGPVLVRVWRGAEVLASRLVDLQPGSEQQVTIEVP